MEAVNDINGEYLFAKELILSDQSFDIENYSYLVEMKDKFFKDNPNFMQNKILKNFLDEEYNLNLFVLTMFGEEDIKNLLNERFKEFYFQYRFVAYISKLLYFEAINYDRKKRKLMENEHAILDKSFKEEGNIYLSDKIISKEPEFELISNKFDDYIIDENLYKAYKNLTNKQQQILYLAYYNLLKDVEIAKKLSITQQAVSKSRRKALNVLRKSIRREGDE